MTEWRPLAEQGDASAQTNLGKMYHQGHGVPRDYAEAMKWYRLAAEQGFALAQSNLGGMYISSHGVPRNSIQGYMWASLAAAQGNEKAVKGLELLEKSMTLDELAEAQRLAREWKPKGK